MIVVIGLPAYATTADGQGSAGGLAVEVAETAHRRGGAVELVGKVGDDGAGDAVVVALGRLGIGHAALLRDAARPTPVLAPVAGADGADGADGSAVEPSEGDASDDQAAPIFQVLPADPAARPGLDAGDISLALHYLAEARVVVMTEPLPEAAAAALVEGASYSGSRLVVLVAAGAQPPALPADATVLETPAADDGSFARLVGAYAAGLDAGTEPGAAFADAVQASGWEVVPD
jgi:hypothetical protein